MPTKKESHAAGVSIKINPGSTGGVLHPAQPPRLCETNPIYCTGTACRAPISQNEPNFSIPSVPTPPHFCKTNPIYRTGTACRAPKNAKRTQSPHHRHPPSPTAPPFMRNEPNLLPTATRLCETNPISNHQYTIYNIHYIISWPISSHCVPHTYLVPQSGLFRFFL